MRMRYVCLPPLCNLVCSLLRGYEGVIMQQVSCIHISLLCLPVAASQRLALILYAYTRLALSRWLLQQLTAHE